MLLIDLTRSGISKETSLLAHLLGTTVSKPLATPVRDILIGLTEVGKSQCGHHRSYIKMRQRLSVHCSLLLCKITFVLVCVCTCVVLGGPCLLHHRAEPLGKVELGKFDCAYPMLHWMLGYREVLRHSSGGGKAQPETWGSLSWPGGSRACGMAGAKSLRLLDIKALLGVVEE